jgi:cytochrome c-type biogenesis protein CcmH/NrfF
MARSTPSGFERPPRRAETALLWAQTVCYTVVAISMILLVALFWSDLKQQQRYHDRQDRQLEKTLQESNALLYQHEQQRQAHERLLQR